VLVRQSVVFDNLPFRSTENDDVIWFVIRFRNPLGAAAESGAHSAVMKRNDFTIAAHRVHRAV